MSGSAATPGDTKLPDAEARQRIREDLDATLIVEAAAGTGKTSELVQRIVAVVAAGHRGATLDSLIAMTFTERAAGEMKLRLREALEKARHAETFGSARARRLGEAVAALEVAHIGTTHGVCADLLREYPVEAGVDPKFEVAVEDEADALLDEAFDGWFERALADPPEGVRRFLRRRGRDAENRTPRERLRYAAGRLVEHRDYDAPWRRPAFRREEALEGVLPRLRELAAFARKGDPYKPLTKYLLEVERFLADLDHREAVNPRDLDGLEAGLWPLRRAWGWDKNGSGKFYASGISRETVVALRDAVHGELERVLAACDADLAACLHAELLPVIGAYDAAKRRAGKLDFFDLQFSVRKLVQGDFTVRRRLQTRFTHLFIDEFQDTDPLQADIVRLLAAANPDVAQAESAEVTPGKLFIVGDPKQAIYGFRRADVTVYERVKAKLTAGGAAVLNLTTSFRGDPVIQDAVNAAFAPVMGDGTATQAKYVPLHAYRERVATQPALVALPVPRPYAKSGYMTNGAIDTSYPGAVAAFIEYLIKESRWTVVDPVTRSRGPIEPRHICVLFKRFNSFTGDTTHGLARGLEGRGIPHVLVGGRSFHQREEVHALRSALTAVEWPDDELSVYATLKGPLFGFHDETLLGFKNTVGTLNPLRPSKSEELAEPFRPVSSALALLRRLHYGRNRNPIADTINQLLEATCAFAGFAFRDAGDRALANLAQLADIGRRFDSSAASSFRAFVERLETDYDEGARAEAPLVEEGTEGVRMMTVHGAKGLEFPVVVLADPTAPAGRLDPDRWVDQDAHLWAEALGGCIPTELLEHADEARRRDREETTRLTYVAATRARDLLVVPVVGVKSNADEMTERWLDVLAPALFPPPATWQQATPAPGCPAFGNKSVVERSDRDPEAPMVAPGLHTPLFGTHSVVWWDPNVLRLDVPKVAGNQHFEVLQDDGAGGQSKASAGAYEAWRQAREKLLAEASKPMLNVLTAREAPVLSGPTVEHASTNAPRTGRPGGKRFGELVHRSLAAVSLDASQEAVARTVGLHARALAAPEAEQNAAVEAVVAALEHPLLKRATKATAVRRESPVLLKLDDGGIAEGVVDLVFRDASQWIVVDFKTSDELSTVQGAYEAQLSCYVTAVARATDQPTRGVLLAV